MKGIRHAVLVLWVLGISPGQGHATPFGEAPPEEAFTSCGYNQLSAQYTAARAKYSFAGTCIESLSQISVSWSAQGVYSEGNGQTEEKVVFNGPSPWRGDFRIKMICAGPTSSDPWLKDTRCTQIQTAAQGELAAHAPLLAQIKRLTNDRQRPLTASFPYNRNSLLAQRQTDLQAAVARAEQEKRRMEQQLQGATQPPVTYREALSPVVRSPVAGQRFLNQTVVPIKLGSPQGLASGGYMVRIERKDPKGNWVAHTTLPIGAAQAESATGYTGFGAGVPPGGITTPGTWRLSAQVSSPKPSGWSDWVEFVVMAPPTSTNKLLQPPMRSFGK